MTLRYSRWSTRDALPDVEAHVRAHLSAVADGNDSPTSRAGEVRIHHEDVDGGVLVTGELDAKADAPYLRPGFTPEQDVEANPLTVEPIGDRP
ncbi:hypothetical protein [Actinophytocola sp.]|uniref:hypothetical protein n=1 Tax=Actinophytocola sp. TaxID=1872138 RepID=UPI003899F3F7